MADDRTPEAKPETPAPKPQRDLRQDITDRLVQSLDQGRIPWDRPWQNLEHGLPRNMTTGREYRGGNRFMLMMAQLDQAYADPRFGTIQQINALGGKVKKGEHGHPIELWKEQPFWERRDVSVTLNGMRVKVFGAARDGSVQIGMPTDQASTLNVKATDLRIEQHKNGEKLSLDWKQAKALDSVVGRTFTVFNAEQCTGLKIEPLPKPEQKFDAVQRGEQIKTAMERDGLTFAEHPKFAFYSPKRDEVSLPPQGQFNDEKGYYGTLLHEIGHATGAEKRLNREGITGGHRFGSEGYAREELRAEMFSMMMAAETGIPHDPRQHTAYVQSWAKVLKQDKNEIFRAAAEAGKAVDYVLAKEQSLQVMQERQASVKQVGLAASQTAPAPTLRASLEDAGWAFKTTTGNYEKTFLLTKDKDKGGEFTHGKTVAEKVLFAKTSAQGLVIEHGWDDVPVPGTVGVDPREAVRLLDAAAKELLVKEHAHLGVTAVRGQNEALQTEQPAPNPSAELKAIWTAKGLSPERQSEMLAQIEAKAQPGAQVGPFVIGAPTPHAGAYESAVQNFVRGGGNEKDARRTLDSELAGDYDPKHLPAALVFHGFAKPAEAEKLAAAIIAEENKKMLDKEDRKSSEFHVAKQAEEAAGKDKPKRDERTAEKSSELEGDKPDRPLRPRLRQATRKAAAMER